MGFKRKGNRKRKRYNLHLETGKAENMTDRDRRKIRKIIMESQKLKDTAQPTDAAIMEAQGNENIENSVQNHDDVFSQFQNQPHSQDNLDDNFSITEEINDAEATPDDDYFTEFMNLLEKEAPQKNQDQLRAPQSFDQLLNDPKLFQTIMENVDKSYGEVLLMALKFALRNKLPLASIESVFAFVNLIFEKCILFQSRYYIDKIFNPKTNCEFHAMCPKCKSYAGKLGSVDFIVECKNCHERMDLSTPSCLNFFMIIDPSEAVADLIKEYEDYYCYIMNERKHVKNRFKDIYDGRRYRAFVKRLRSLGIHNYVTFNFNTDGAPKFKSSKFSIWPIYLQVNEIPQQERMNNIVTCGMWFGKSKPEMTSFLKPFAEKMQQLSQSGIDCIVKDNKCKIKAFPLVAVVDSVARAPMQGLKQFNGKYGCSWCLHPGKSAGGSMKYPMLQTVPERRDSINYLEHLQRVEDEDVEDVFGVMYGSELALLEGFEIINGFVPDYLHCYASGAGKQMAEELISLIPNLEEADRLMKNIKVPVQIGRLTKALSDRGDWKAREWENFILFYSVPIFSALILDEKLVEYWSFLSTSLHTFLKDDISVDELNKVKQKLIDFSFETEKKFTTTAMTWNMHQLLHITDSVLDWGPLWAHSTFPFESYNHEILQAIHCARGVNQQIVRYINLQRYTKILQKHIFINCSPFVKNYCENLDSLKIKNSQKLTSITYLGNEEKLSEVLINNLNLAADGCTQFSRIVKDSCVYTSRHVINNRSDNSFAQLKNGIFIVIEHFILDKLNNREIVAHRQIQTSTVDDCNVIHKVINVSQKIMEVSTHDIDKICVYIPTCEDNYIMKVPNLLHY